MSLCQRLSVLVASDRRDSVAAPDDEVSRVFERRKIFEIEENMSKSTKSAAAQSHFAKRRAQAGGSASEPGSGRPGAQEADSYEARGEAALTSASAQDILLQL